MCAACPRPPPLLAWPLAAPHRPTNPRDPRPPADGLHLHGAEAKGAVTLHCHHLAGGVNHGCRGRGPGGRRQLTHAWLPLPRKGTQEWLNPYPTGLVSPCRNPIAHSTAPCMEAASQPKLRLRPTLPRQRHLLRWRSQGPRPWCPRCRHPAESAAPPPAPAPSSHCPWRHPPGGQAAGSSSRGQELVCDSATVATAVLASATAAGALPPKRLHPLPQPWHKRQVHPHACN